MEQLVEEELIELIEFCEVHKNSIKAFLEDAGHEYRIQFILSDHPMIMSILDDMSKLKSKKYNVDFIHIATIDSIKELTYQYSMSKSIIWSNL